MMNFRKGNVNCLFATSVAEEGLDIPDCNLVVRFDLYTTLIQYIQSRGRARHANSRYIHMYEENNLDHTQIIREVRVNESILKNFCRQLPEDRLLTGCSFDMDHFLAKEKSHRVYKVPETGAKLTYKISLMVLSNFVDSLPHGPDIILSPEYVMTIEGKQFICEVVLPEASPVRGAVGRPCSTKQVAKCSAAFETCLLLRQGKYLNEWLLPIFTKQLPVMRNALLAVDSKKREAYDMRTKPEMWSAGSIPEEFFVSVLSLGTPECLDRTSQPLALLTRSPMPQLPSFQLHFGSGKNSPVQVTSYSKPMKVDASCLNQINLFTLCIFDDVFSKSYESNQAQMPYFLVPIKSHSSIDQCSDPSEAISWDILKSIEEHHAKWADKPWENTAWQNAPDEFFEDKFIVDPWDGSRKMWSVKVDRRFKPLDPVPSNSAPRPGTRKNNDNIMEYSCSLWAKARARRTFDENQKVIEARYISLRRNLLDEFDASKTEAARECWVILEPLKISPVGYICTSKIHLLTLIAPCTYCCHGLLIPCNNPSN
jgi:endoribonuclease Dicer